MSYLALARKWRPRSFAELVGQEHVRVALGVYLLPACTQFETSGSVPSDARSR